MSASPTPPSNRTYWLCQFGGWGLNALLQFWAAVIVGPELPSFGPPPAAVAWWIAAIEVTVLNGAALFITHWLRGFMRGHQWQALNWPALAWRVLLTGFLAGIPLGLVQPHMAVASLHPVPPQVPAWAGWLLYSINWSGWFWIWLTLYYVVQGARRRRHAELRESELARELHLAELRLLKSQLNPHFLFNALNSVRALIADDPKRAQDAVTRLARLLRYTLGSAQHELVSLQHELEIVDDYLGLEALRLGERLRVERDISPAAAQARIPVMLMQTLVENAIKHGIAERPDGGTLRLAARTEEGALIIEIGNPVPAAGRPASPDGIGLRNAQERLRLLFGAAASLTLDLSRFGQAVARLRVPVSG